MYILYLSEAAHRVLSRYIIPIPIPMRGGSLIILQSCVVLLFMYIVELQNIVHSKYNYIEKLNAPFFGQLTLGGALQVPRVATRNNLMVRATDAQHGLQ